MTGGVNFWADRRQIRDGTRLDVTYDMAKLWTIAYPTLTPEQQASYKDLKIAGKYTKTFTLSGAFPAAPTLAQSIKSLNADGSLTIDLLDTMGLRIERFSPQVKMTRGVVTLSGSPAVANSGSMSFDGIVVDMTQVEPTLSIPKNKKLLQGVKLDTALASTLGKMGAIVFTNASTADGALSFTAVNCDRLPLGQFNQPNKNYSASFILAVDDLLLDGPVLKVLAAVAQLGTGGIQGRIPPSTLKVNNGLADTNLTVEIARSVRERNGQTGLQGMPLNFAGGVNLTTLDLKDFKVSIPPEMLPPDIRKFSSNGLVVPLKGNATKPNVDFDPAKFLRDNAVKGLIGGNGNGDNPVGDLLKGLGGGGNNEQQPQQTQPRRQRNQGQ
ncbi:MAG TPA: hypothetical protein VHD56_14445, partial [Tepidisphaeraceae bacterium]|nr:hypothetical protein [Tepidisphaeraceae bacterium]